MTVCFNGGVVAKLSPPPPIFALPVSSRRSFAGMERQLPEFFRLMAAQAAEELSPRLKPW